MSTNQVIPMIVQLVCTVIVSITVIWSVYEGAPGYQIAMSGFALVCLVFGSIIAVRMWYRRRALERSKL